MQLEESIFNRRSVREYTSEAVDEATVKRLIGGGASAKRRQRAALDLYGRTGSQSARTAFACGEASYACDDVTPRDRGLSLGTRRSAV